MRMDRSTRQARADLRRRMAVLNRTRLARTEPDPTPLNGPDALSLVVRLTRESWTLAGRDFPRYTREQIPVRFVPGRPK
jgi:hypothetical protein